MKNNIKRLRVESEMTQLQVSGRTGINNSLLSSYEHQRRTPSISTAFKLARVFGVPVEALFSPDDGNNEKVT